MSEWREFRLEDFAEIQNQKRIPLSAMVRSKRKGSFPYYGASGIVDYVDDYIFDGEYVLVSEDGENLKTRKTSIAFKASGRFWVNNHAHILKCKKDYLSNLIVYYFQNLDLNEFISGAVQPKLNKASLASIPIFLPKIEAEQKAIAAVLSSLDDKIDLLHRQNKTLEAMAATLFRQWFVEEAQEEWGECSVSDFAEHIKNNVVPANSKNELFHHYSLPAFDDGKRPTVELGSEILSNKYKVASDSILVSKLNPRVPRIWPIGDLQSENAICSTEFQVFKPKNEKLYGYLYFLLRSNDAVDALTMAASGTSGSHQRVRPEDILNIRTSLPSIQRVEEYSKLAMTSIDKARSNLVQIQTLENLRDTLLPKLMSGEVRVAI